MINSLLKEPLAVLIPLIAKEPQLKVAEKISKQWGFKIRQPKDNDDYVLEVFDGRLQLSCCEKKKTGAITVDFVSGASEYRRKYGGGKNQAIARAVGLRNGSIPDVVDVTAGLGRDAFVLASLGCRVHMVERSPVIAALLDDGLNRAKADSEIGPWVSERMSLVFQDSRDYLSKLSFSPDVVYLDPMYPEKRKSALVKKEMRVLQSILGYDLDAGGLLKMALKTAQKRVVVKRPAYANCLSGQKPNTSIKMKKNRFDIYLVNNVQI